MEIVFVYRTYSIFGGNATLNIAGKWLSKQLKENYGGTITSITIEFCAKNVSPPRKSLEKNNDKFEEFFLQLPIVEVQQKGTELRICSRLVKHYHDDIERDSQVLSLKVFKTTLGKSASLIESSGTKNSNLKGLDTEALSRDIRSVIEKAPQTLRELAMLYLEQQT
ncbi:hypothetical protein UB33_11190 [Photobacterium angustum]|uniref:hypothetical protein n=1 Tax=Photobacterium angustum TaxID=661 RepID=UPI0005E511E0|nr:hypothetical protein [Photobacterium angustum]KJG05921.1 hypothetical protein UB33_11190 [Photobacterium angustum]PSV92587.1 hypothetical protein CTN01_12220 [Photobacterium angustum]